VECSSEGGDQQKKQANTYDILTGLHIADLAAAQPIWQEAAGVLRPGSYAGMCGAVKW